ncbi:MAG: Uma2 family endonuclease [Saprospiraceae bacterium]
MAHIAEYTIDSSDAGKDQRRYSLTEYLKRESRSKYKHEFLNGQIVRMPYAKGPHNIITANISAELIIGSDKTDSNCVVFSSDQKIYFPILNEGVYPDVVLVNGLAQYTDPEKLLLLNPCLVIEVLSKSTADYDRTAKFEKYKSVDSFEEYLLVSQDEPKVEIWSKRGNGDWIESIAYGISGIINLSSQGFSVRMDRIYSNVQL